MIGVVDSTGGLLFTNPTGMFTIAPKGTAPHRHLSLERRLAFAPVACGSNRRAFVRSADTGHVVPLGGQLLSEGGGHDGDLLR
jgi:hypothetical protein